MYQITHYRVTTRHAVLTFSDQTSDTVLVQQCLTADRALKDRVSQLKCDPNTQNVKTIWTRQHKTSAHFHGEPSLGIATTTTTTTTTNLKHSWLLPLWNKIQRHKRLVNQNTDFNRTTRNMSIFSGATSKISTPALPCPYLPSTEMWSLTDDACWLKAPEDRTHSNFVSDIMMYYTATLLVT